MFLPDTAREALGPEYVRSPPTRLVAASIDCGCSARRGIVAALPAMVVARVNAIRVPTIDFSFIKICYIIGYYIRKTVIVMDCENYQNSNYALSRYFSLYYLSRNSSNTPLSRSSIDFAIL